MIKRLVALPFLAMMSIAARPAPEPAKPQLSVTAPAEIAADPANRWTLELSTGGKVVVQLRPDIAPQHVYRIQQLTSQGFYNGLKFHRVIPGFMAQGGDPKGTGEGGSSLPDLPAEFNDLPHLRGVASMARTEDPNSANSQFFIMLTPRFGLDQKYTAFGRVIEGMAAVDGIAVGEPPANPTTIVRASIGGPLPQPPAVAVAAVPAVPAAEPAATSAKAAGPADDAAQAPSEEPEAVPATTGPAEAVPGENGPAPAAPSPEAPSAEPVATPEPAAPPEPTEAAPEEGSDEAPTPQ